MDKSWFARPTAAETSAALPAPCIPAQPCSPTTAGNGPAPSGLARSPWMRSPAISVPESSRCEALSNSTGCRGVAHASDVSAPPTQQSVSTTAAWKVTVLDTAAFLECAGATLLRRLDTCGLDQFGIASDFLLDKSAELLRAHRQQIDAKACELLGRIG